MSFFRAVIYLLIRSKIYQYIAYQRRLKEVTETLNESYEKSRGIRDFLALIRNYQGLKELDTMIRTSFLGRLVFCYDTSMHLKVSDKHTSKTPFSRTYVPLQAL